MRTASVRYYQDLYDTETELKTALWKTRIDWAVNVLRRDRNRYLLVERETGVPWVVTGIIHILECGGQFSKCLMNGQPWDKKTTIVPRGFGPWKSWFGSACEALKHDKIDSNKNWSPGGIGKVLERYNGMGYAKHNVNSPYLWSGCNHGRGVGKYVSDGRYSKSSVSGQVGAMVILKRAAAVGLYTVSRATGVKAQTFNGVTLRRKCPTDASEISAVKAVQKWLNKWFGFSLRVDGWSGKKTMAALDRSIDFEG